MSILSSDVMGRARQHLLTRESEGVVDKSAFMEFAALERGLPVERLTPRAILVKVNGHQLGFAAMNGPSCTPFGRAVCNDKQTARRLIESHGLPVAESKSFRTRDMDSAWDYAYSLEGPVVVKPLSLSRSRGLTTSITTRDSFREALGAARKAHRGNRDPFILVERQVQGLDYRLFVVDGVTAYATLRQRASVIGDGQKTIEELIAQKNLSRHGNPYLGQLPIPTDTAMLDLLGPQNLSLSDVPETGEQISLCSVPNLYRGGDSIDVTDRVHPSYKELAVHAVNAIPGIEYAGVDLIVQDIETEATSANVIVSEVEYSPAPISYFPWRGEHRDMGGPILDFYLRTSRSSRLSRFLTTRRRPTP